MTSTANRFESTIGGVTVSGRAHSSSAWFVLALWLMMGYAFLYAGATKLLAAEPFDAQGYLLGAVPQASPFVELYTAMGQTPWFIEFVNVAVPWGQVAIGLALLLGTLTRFGAFWGAFMMALFYFGNWESNTVWSTVTPRTCSCSPPSRPSARAVSSGLDAIVERYEIDGQSLIERYPKLGYVLG